MGKDMVEVILLHFAYDTFFFVELYVMNVVCLKGVLICFKVEG